MLQTSRPPLAALLLTGLAFCAPSAAADLASLLERLAKHQETTRPVYERGFTMTSRIEELDKTGRPETTMETVEKVTRKDGKQQNELVRAVRDGKDVTEQERRRRAERKEEAAKKDGSGSRRHNVSASVVSPFARDEQSKYRFTLAGPDPSRPGRLGIRFEPRGAPSDRSNTGEAVVDEAAGVPIQIRYRPSMYPKHVKKMDVELEYGIPTGSGPVLSVFSIDAEGGLLFIKKRIRTKTTFSDYSSAGSGGTP